MMPPIINPTKPQTQPKIESEGQQLGDGAITITQLQEIKEESARAAAQKREEMAKIMAKIKNQLEDERRYLAEEKRLLEEEQARAREAASGTRVMGYTPDRVGHNVAKETERLGQSVSNLLTKGKFKSDKKLKKEKKAKKEKKRG